MWNSKLAFSLIVVMCGVSVVWGGHLFQHPMKARRQCYLPNYAYSQSNKTNPKSATSFSGSTVATVTAGASTDNRRIKTFIMNQSELKNDHCSISKLAWTVDSDGNWVVSFDASQDPMSVPDAQRPKFVRFIQNKLYVTIRAYGLYAADNDTNVAVVGQPQLANIPLKGFWLKRGETKRIFLKDEHGKLKESFPFINRIEIDLQYE